MITAARQRAHRAFFLFHINPHTYSTKSPVSDFQKAPQDSTKDFFIFFFFHTTSAALTLGKHLIVRSRDGEKAALIYLQQHLLCVMGALLQHVTCPFFEPISSPSAPTACFHYVPQCLHILTGDANAPKVYLLQPIMADERCKYQNKHEGM